jgi:hypothetical protein
MAQSHTARRALASRQVEDIRAVRFSGLFPLTPTLSLGERVNPTLRRVQSRPFGSPLRNARCSLSLRERVRVRGNGAVIIPCRGPFPELSNRTSPPAEVSLYDNDEARMTNAKRITKSKCPMDLDCSSSADWDFEHSGFFRHLSFVIRISAKAHPDGRSAAFGAKAGQCLGRKRMAFLFVPSTSTL